MSKLTNQDLIKRVHLFEMLTPVQVESLTSALTKQRFKRNECVVELGGQSNALYIILAGTARVVLTNEKGREVIVASLRTGDYIGEMSLIDNEPHSATVVAETQLDVLTLSREGFSKCVMGNASTSLAVMRGLVRRLRQANQKIASFALSGVYERVAKILLESAVKSSDGSLLIHDKYSHLEIAKMVGSSREMVSRAMKDFEEQSFIRKLDGGVVRVYERRAEPRT
jgi:CRP-like cAMP-binding protein